MVEAARVGWKKATNEKRRCRLRGSLSVGLNLRYPPSPLLLRTAHLLYNLCTRKGGPQQRKALYTHHIRSPTFLFKSKRDVRSVAQATLVTTPDAPAGLKKLHYGEVAPSLR